MKQSNVVVGLLALALFCYFIFPVVFFLPLKAFGGPSFSTGMTQKIELFFTPVTFLADRFPLYKFFLQAQVRYFLEGDSGRKP